MDNSFTIKKGYTLLELTAVMAVIIFLLAMIIINCTSLMNRARFQATVREMDSLAQASIDYYNSSNNPNALNNPLPLVWPSDPSLLANNMDPDKNNMPQVVNVNPFGYSYQLEFANDMVTVSTTIPKGILIDPNEGSFLTVTPELVGDGKIISITQSVPNEFTGRLFYDLEYLDRK